MRYVAATGALGAGVDRAALFAALECGPRFIAADAGTTDASAFALGTGQTAFSRTAVKRDLETMLDAGIHAGIPVIVGSAGTAGADLHVDWVLAIVDEICAERAASLRGFAIYSEQRSDDLQDDLRMGRVAPLGDAAGLLPEDLARCERIVAMMGVEPIQRALEFEPAFVVAGRCSDAALFAALPLMHGYDAGLAWHAGKIVECGTMACETMGPGVMVVELAHDHFTVRPIGNGLRCTPQSVAAHSLYETADPFHFVEPSGTLDISGSTYEAVNESAVLVRGSRFIPSARYSVKLEGAELTGYRSMIVGGIRDPFILGSLESWLGDIREYVGSVARRQLDVELDGARYGLDFKVYGRNAVMGRLEPKLAPDHEVGLVCSTLAPTQAEATEIAKLCRQPLLHAPIDKWSGSITAFACLLNPAWVEVGPVYRFSLNHVLVVGDPLAAHRLESVESGARAPQIEPLAEAAS